MGSTPHSKDRSSLRGPVAAALSCAALVVLGLALMPSAPDWLSWRPASCLPDHCFCEALRRGAVRQPANTWSNLGFVFVGVWILARRELRRGTPMRDAPAYRVSFGAMCVLLGVSSGLYHASLTFFWQFFDLLGMYLLPGFFALYNVGRVRRLTPARFVLTYVAVIGALSASLIWIPALRRYLFAIMIVLAIASELYARRAAAAPLVTRWFVAALGAFGLGLGIWVLDLKRLLCAPEAWLQGHALWHLLCALSCGLAFVYLSSSADAQQDRA